ncbi:MAG: hypothetical protein ACHQT8_03345 [Chlamydiales bacterium]
MSIASFLDKPSVAREPIRNCSAAILQEIFSFCTGDELRRFELTCRFFRKFFFNPSGSRIWFQALEHELGGKRLITYDRRINYKALHLLFAVKIYRVKKSSYVWVMFLQSYVHPKPERNRDLKCSLDCCKTQEEELYKALMTKGRHDELFRKTFSLLARTLGTRGLYDGSGNRILWCVDCEHYKPASHGTTYYHEKNKTSCAWVRANENTIVYI